MPFFLNRSVFTDDFPQTVSGTGVRSCVSQSVYVGEDKLLDIEVQLRAEYKCELAGQRNPANIEQL